MKRVIVVAGSPGVGKTSISEGLAHRLNGVNINLSELVRHEGLSCGFDERRGTMIADMEKVSGRVREIIQESDRWIIVDGHFAMDVVPVENVFLTFVLRREPDELREVLSKRGFENRKVTENVAAEILDVCLFDAVEAYGKRKVCEVDISQRSESEIVEEVIQIINGQKECRIGKVDWLTKLELAGRLEEFLDEL
ncbi:adenylate kinase family protein [Candidatus Bathyarchaeota archaeon]|nr:adenylate kinase family protein [Candidatus Bathyarchaeota archaeon]